MSKRHFTGALGPIDVEDILDIVTNIVADAGEDGVSIEDIIDSVAAIGDVDDVSVRRLIRRKFNCRKEDPVVKASYYKAEIIVRLKV